MWTYNETCYPDFMYHHGIRGQRWGRRRYQDTEGHYTAEGRERYGIGDGMPYHNLNYKPGQNSARDRADAMMTRRSSPQSAEDVARRSAQRRETPMDRIRRRQKERQAAVEQERMERQAKQTRLLDSPSVRREKVIKSGKGTASILVGTVLKTVGTKLAFDIAGDAIGSKTGSLLKLYGNVAAASIAVNGALDASAKIF